MKNEIGDFLDYLTYERNVSINTISAYRDDLESFVSFLCNDYFTLGRDQLDFRKVDNLTVRAYLAHLARRKLARVDRAATLGVAHVLSSPDARGRCRSESGARVATPKREKHLPSVLQPAEVALLLEQPDVSTPLGLRDRAFLELMYASGLRISELVGIDMDDIEIRARLVKVRGKGSKERIVPFGTKAQDAIRAYLPARVADGEEDALFVNYRGDRITARSVRRSVRQVCPRRSAAGRASRRTRFVTPLPHTSSTPAPTSAASRSFSATPPSRRRRSTRTSTTGSC